MIKSLLLRRGYRPPQAEQMLDGRLIIVDYMLEKYPMLTRAYLGKRFIKRREIWPRLYMVPPVQELGSQLEIQRISGSDGAVPDRLLQQQEQELQVTPEFAQTKLFEPHFKPLLVQLLQRELISGAVVPFRLRAEYQKVKDQCDHWFRVFYFGEVMTDFERNVALRYLASKQEKHSLYQQQAHNNYRCEWTALDQAFLDRRVGLVGDSQLVDSQRLQFKPLDFKVDAEQQLKIMEFERENVFKRLKFKHFEMRHFEGLTKQSIEWRTAVIFNRLGHWCKSKEFLSELKVPPDFFIELNMLTCHVWLVMNQLTESKHPKAEYTRKALAEKLKMYTDQKVGLLSIRRKNDFANEIKNIRTTINCVLYEQFVFDQRKALNPYERIDSLVWSFVYLEKVPRYDPQVFRFSEYLVQNYYHCQRYSFQQLTSGGFSFDVFRKHPQFAAKIRALNPPLSPAELTEQEQSQKEVKRYHYTYERKLDMVYTKAEFESRIKNIKLKARELSLKYGTLNSYDYFSQLEENKEAARTAQKQRLWKAQEGLQECDIRSLLQQKQARS